MKKEDISNTRELPNLNISDASYGHKSGLPQLDLLSGVGGLKADVKEKADRQDALFSGERAAKKSFEIVGNDESEDIVSNTFASEKDTFDNDISSSSSSGADDDFIIGKGFKITERDENISLGGARSSNSNSQRERRDYDERGRKKSKKRSSGCLGTVIWILVILIISVSIAAAVLIAASDVFGIGKSGVSEVNIEIGSSTASIAESLKEAGAIRSSTLFRLYSKLKKTDGTYQYGLYAINNEGGYDGIIDQLQTEGAKAKTVEVQIGDGWGIDKIGRTLEENGVCTQSDFISVIRNYDFKLGFEEDIPVETVYYRLEGYLHPDTYQFYVVEDSKQGAVLAARRMLEATDKFFTDENLKKAEDLGYSMHEILTMASIIQLEAGGADFADMQNVAAVFYNRLEDGMTLGSSPTTAYPHGNGRYNTYEIIGLPPGPLCSVNADSINAALNPTADFDYLYFVTDANADFHYNMTLAEHNNTINRLEASGNWLGDKQEDLENMFK